MILAKLVWLPIFDLCVEEYIFRSTRSTSIITSVNGTEKHSQKEQLCQYTGCA